MDRIIRAVFGATKSTVTTPLWQYDYGQQMEIVNSRLRSPYEVHFSNQEFSGSAKTVIAVDGVCDIPDEYLVNGEPIYAWIYYHDGESDGKTVFSIKIPVNKRSAISNAEPTPQQQDVITQTIALLTSSVEHVEDIADEIPNTIDSALQEAKDSGEFDGPKGDKGDAATIQVGTVTTLPAESQATVVNRGTSKDAVFDFGIPKGETGEPGTTSWDGITDKPESFPPSAHNHDERYYTEAEVDDLIDDVTDAVDDLSETMNNKADIIATSATGSMVSITDAGAFPVTALSVDIEPVQDLSNGDPSPDNICPITGHTQAVVTRTGKNVFNSDLASAIGTATNNGITFAYNSTTQTFSVSGTATGGAINAYLIGSYNNTTPAFTLKAGTYTFSVTSGTGVLFYSFDGETRQAFDCKTTGNTYTLNSDTPITAIKPLNKTSGNTYNESFQIQLELGSTATDYDPYQGTSVTIDLDGTRYGCVVDVTNGVLTVDRAFADMGNTNLNWGIEYTKDDYIVFRATNFISVFQAIASQEYNAIADIICNRFPAKSHGGQASASNTDIGVSYWAGMEFQVPKTLASTVNDWKSYIANNTIVLVYPLATPITYTLTPQQMTLLLGENHIWADTGDVSIDYRADTKLYIDKKFAELQALILEN